MKDQKSSSFFVGAWLAPLPGALQVWVDLARRGESAVLDLRHAKVSVAEIAAAVAGVGPHGLRVIAAFNDADDECLTALANIDGISLTAVLPVGTEIPESLSKAVEYCFEVRSADSIPEDDSSSALAYVLTGHEAGGAVGEATSFMLLQKARAKTQKPLWIRGGVGPATAAAVAAGGAEGAFIDDGLLLFPELDAAPALQQALGRLNGSETRLIGENIDAAYRIFTPLRSAAAEAADAIDAEVERGDCDATALAERMAGVLGWSAEKVWPVGQGVGFAAALAEKHGRIFRLLASTRRSVKQALADAAEQKTLAEGGPLALAQGTRYPLVQGPMTRVSDSPAFAANVAEGGALPFLALALLRGNQVDDMLAETTRLLGEKPWGVGLLGFIPEALRKEQLAAVAKYDPKFALIAGGRPDQAAEFEKQGVAAWLHVPSPALLRMYIEQGARRFIFEGRECGGHIGPLSSFALWEQMIAILRDDIDADAAGEIEVLFAGGISDAQSSAMVAAMAAPLASRGIKVGALMGTAYLFTREISESGAVLPEFTEQAIACQRTRNLTTGPGHATRCADTPFAAEFLRERQRLSKEGLSAEALRDELEDLNLGRLRLASKGQERDAEGQLVERDEEAQRRDGMYMIGQVATLHDKALSIAELHEQVCTDSQALLQALAPTRVEEQPETVTPADVAVVGINVILPHAHSNDVLWKKLVNLEKTITEVPKERWDSALYFDADKNARDKVYSRWGGFLDDILFDPTQYGIAPNSMRSIDPMQLLSLESTARALKDAGFPDDFDREHTSIILGAGGGVGELGLQYGVRAEIPRFIEDPDDGVWDRLPEWTNESFAGVLLNVAAGRIANRLNFGGVNFVVDAACGSSLAAITLAVQELTSGRSNVAIAGGVDNVQGPYGFLCFSKTQALSPTGQPRTFDQNADGIAISEGVATVVMKRLADAERDGDRIYAVIKGAAGSSDGKALGMTAPLPAGQKRALRRVYRQAGYGPETLGYVEAHGTGTAVGDRAEAETIVGSLIEHGAAPARTAVGSAKTLVGHTKCAAGVVGLIKSTLALHHRVLPGHFGVSDPIEPFQGDDTPAYLLKKSRPWLRRADAPRRASVSAFGFGGTNFHATLEEYPDAMAVPGATDWPQELFVLTATSRDELAKRATELAAALASSQSARLSQLTASLAQLARANDAAVLSFVADSADSAVKALQSASAHLTQGQALAPGIELNTEVPTEAPKLGFLFPGQGAQAVGRGCESALYLAPLRAAMEKADTVLADYLPQPLSECLWPKAAFDDATQAAQQARLTDTRVAQPALGALASGFYQWLNTLGVQASACAGHSYGEFVALYAAGSMSENDMLMLSAERGAAMAAAAATAPGAMAAVLAAREVVEELIADIADAHLANHNSPEQVVITGTVEAVEKALAKAEAREIRAQKLPVSGAFHSPLMAAAKEPLSAAIERVNWQAAKTPVYANRDGQPYPAEPALLAAQLDEHLLGPVEFVTQLKNMHAAGIRHFVEVGSKSLLAGMAARTLGDSAECFSVDAGAGGLSAALGVLAALRARGVRMALPTLWKGRVDQVLASNWAGLLAGLKDKEPARTAWLLSGGAARPLSDPEYKTGKKTALTLADKQAAQQRKQAAAAQAAVTPPPVVASQAQTTAGISPTAPSTAVPASVAETPVQHAPMTSDSTAMDAQAFAAYQETMRSFLELQEKALTMALNGQPAAALPATPTAPPPAATVMPNSAAQVMPAPAITPAPVVSPEPAPVAAQPEPATVSAPQLQPQPQPEPSPSVSAAIDVAALVLGITADKTGYPEDMLDREADLEADLGIDSIKRVEIVGAIQKALPEAVSAAMQSDLERYTRAKSLQSLIDSLSALQASTAPAASAGVSNAVAAAPAPVAPSVAPVMDVRAQVLSITADKTGYPEDMLDLAADLEADLGIDSIKRVEIVGAIQKAVPEAVSAAMQADLERYTRAKSLQQLIDALTELQGQSAAVVNTTAAITTVAPDVPASSPAVDVAALVLSVTADKTGYPADMLDLSADLEADLGIDSIKRVEIVGAIQKALPESVSAAMQSDLERYTRAKSLQLLIDALNEVQGATATAVPTPVSAVSSSQSIEASSTLDVPGMVLSVTADKTGYPADMLDLEADLEADLGIDSIKRVEIVGAIQKALPESIATAMQAELERYTRAKTLAALIAAIEALATTSPDGPGTGGGSVAETPATPTSAAAETSTTAAAVPRQVIQMDTCAAAAADAPISGEIMIVGADEALSAALKSQTSAPLHFVSATEDATAALAATTNWEAVLYLPALFAEDEQSARALLPNWLQWAQAIGTPTQQRRLLVATRFGGDFARRENGVSHPIAGGLVGGMLCLDQEQANLVCRVVDFNGHDSSLMAKLLLAEAATTVGPVEIGYADNQRKQVQTVTEALPDTGANPQAGQVVLATGGARGITLACLQEFVQRQPDVRLVLLGRSAPAKPGDLQGDANQLRQQLIQRARDGGGKLSPREIDTQVARALAAQEVAAGIASLEKAGASVEYHAVDARDAEAMGGLIADIRKRYGRLDGVLHAAGVIEDKLIADKTVESFNRVVGTKVDALSALIPLLAEQPPSWLALFTSVAGRYGNRGQSDYACANEALSRWAWVLDRAWEGCRVRAFNWGPWDAGMASDAVRAQFRERGIIPIPLSTGAAAFVDEIVASNSTAVELVFGAGPWTNSSTSDARSGASSAFVREALEVGPGGALIQKHQLTVSRERFLDQHRLDGQAVLPAAGAAEWLAEVAAAAWPDWQVREVADLEVLSGVSLENDSRDLVVRVRASSHSGAGEQWGTLDLLAADNPRALYRCRVRLGMDDETAPVAPERLEGESLAAADAYAKMLFHGPLFQLVSSVDAINEKGLDAQLQPSVLSEWIDGAQGEWIFDPGVVDCAPQLAIVWSRHQQDATALPSRFGRLARFGTGPLPQKLELRLRVTDSSDTQLKYDAWVLDAQTGEVRLQMVRFSGTVSAALNRLAGQGA